MANLVNTQWPIPSRWGFWAYEMTQHKVLRFKQLGHLFWSGQLPAHWKAFVYICSNKIHCRTQTQSECVGPTHAFCRRSCRSSFALSLDTGKAIIFLIFVIFHTKGFPCPRIRDPKVPLPFMAKMATPSHRIRLPWKIVGVLKILCKLTYNWYWCTISRGFLQVNQAAWSFFF